MSKQALKHRRTIPSRGEIRAEINLKEICRELRIKR